MLDNDSKNITPIVEEMKRSYLNYAMSVIVSRALPDVKDGLKPVHRRILYAMHKLGLTRGARFSKSAKVVGEVLGKYHPHGDSAVYDALVRMGQLFSMRYPLILGQGNFGSIDGDPPAAMRYTEVKMTAIAEEMLFDIERDTVGWRDNFDGTLQEPTYLPAKLPNLLLMGAEGIAVGMATKIPPHNLSEVIDGIIRMMTDIKEVKEKETKVAEAADSGGIFVYTSLIDEKKSQKILFTTPVASLMEHILGPDFPTAANIYGVDEIQKAYATGKGKIMVRATVRHEDTKGGKDKIIIDQLPYQVNKANLVKKIADLVKDKKVIGISDLRDESDRDGIRVVIELKRDAVYKKILNNLYKHTDLQTSYPVNMVALVDNTPQTVSLRTILEQYLKHRIRIVAKRSLYDLNKAKARAHILEGLLIALDHIDEIITIIKKSKNEPEAKEKLMQKFSFSDLQAQAILDMQLKRLTGLERAKIEEELKALQEQIKKLETLLLDVFKILDVIKKELVDIKAKYGDERRTKIFKQRPGSFTDEQLIENKEVIVTLTQGGYIKTVPRNTFKVQKRGGKGVSGFETQDEDNVYLITASQTHDYILFFSDKGKVYQTRVWEIPEGSRISKGKAIVNVLALEQNEQVTSILTYSEDDLTKQQSHFIFMCTKLGTVKKTPLAAFKNIRASGIIAIKLTKDDQLLWSRMTGNSSNVMLSTHLGKSIVFPEKNVRDTGRSSQGVLGIRLEKADAVSSMDVFDPADKKISLIVLSENGIGKKTRIGLFPVQKRGGKGVKIANLDKRTGPIAFSSIVEEDKETLVITSKKGQVVKIPLKSIPALSRVAKGVILMRFNKKDDAVVSATFL
ncbi:DNA gyrase subunit A [Candidatus Roizmanbacteria bacterium RIFCSPHIGHO2_12_FULL_44_10]|uniref:DNA gyrase subunit A n=1 Tax=Candidatus Roizmanbacteria bacterium RIFCSPHIGHO2_12_FULL_44_10 TaxID=1802054 RepID=A0A1F7I6I3_9BACT|nr:MAG: DNA gyrase subunit A [Candidatus Roizmanbacteria bacterium RIFCSPHIGHO2_12_FULL_44_10]